MILSLYRYRPVTVPAPLHRYRDRPLATVTLPLPDRPPLPTVTHRYSPLPTVTFKKILNFLRNILFIAKML
jgi:hypothetical protein